MISQCVNAKQLSHPSKQSVMANNDQSNKCHTWIDTQQRWLIRRSDKLVQNAPTKSEAQKARQAIPGLNEKTPWIKGAAEPQSGSEVKKSQGERGEQEAEGMGTMKDMGNIGPQTRNILGYTNAAGS